MSTYAYVPKGPEQTIVINNIVIKAYAFVYESSSVNMFEMSARAQRRAIRFKNTPLTYVFIINEHDSNIGCMYKLNEPIVDGIYYDSMEFNKCYKLKRINNKWICRQ